MSRVKLLLSSRGKSMVLAGATVGGLVLGAGAWATAADLRDPLIGHAHGIAMHGDPAYPEGFSHLSYVNPDAPHGGTLRQAMVGGFDSLNAFAFRGRVAPGLIPFVYEPLMARVWDEPFSLYGLLASGVRVPPDRDWVEFALRPEARWEDGRPVTAEDVAYTFDILKTHGHPSRRRTHGRVTRVEVMGQDRIRFTFDGSGDRELPLLMAMMPVMPKHVWIERDPASTNLDPPVGSGPYRVAEADPARGITYVRREAYWGRDLAIQRGLHVIERLRYDVYRDEGVAFEAFKAGQIDIRREPDPGRWIAGYQGPALADGRIILEEIPRAIPEPFRAIVFNTRRSLFSDRRVRVALAHAFDFEWMNRALFHAAYARTTSLFPNSELAHTGRPDGAERRLLDNMVEPIRPELLDGPFQPPTTDGSGPAGMRANLRLAQRLLQEAGFVIRDGRLYGRDGADPVRFELLLNGPADERPALEWSRAVGRLGIDVAVRTVDSAQFLGRIDSFDFDAIIHRWGSTLSPGVEQATYWSSAAADQPGSRNYPGIRSETVDRLINGLVTAPTRADLVAHARALDRAVLWEWAMIPLYHLPKDRIARWSHVRRPSITPLFGIVLESWWIDPSGG